MEDIGYPNKFIKHGTVEQIEEKYGLNTEKIYKYII